MTKGITLSILLIIIFFFFGLISTSISFVLLAPIIFTPYNMLDEIISLMRIKKGDKVLDLGSGDGRLLFKIKDMIDTNNNNIKLFGYDISPILILYSKLKQIFVFKNKIIFDVLNIFQIDLKEYDKVYIYLDIKSINILDKNIKNTEKTGVEIYSYRFPFKNLKKTKEYKLPNGEILYKYIH